MPTNRKRRKRAINPTISPALRSYFETGSYDGPFPEEDRCDVFLLCSWKKDLEAAWDTVKDEILADWIKRHPCSRPFGFWILEAPEPRQELESQAAYLDRHGLLSAAEKRHIERHPELLEPETVTT